MSTSLRIVAVATATSMIGGCLAATILVLAAESPESIHYHLFTTSGLSNLLAIGAFSSLPVSIPAGLIGGVLAAWLVVRRDTGMAIASWIRRGFLWGMLVGGGTAAIVIAGPAVTSRAFIPLLLVVVVTGSTTGAIVGTVVGIYCARKRAS